LSFKRALATLKRLGLTNREAQVYLYLSRRGPLEKDELVSGLKLPKTHICLIINKLISKRMVRAASDCSIVYTATSMEIVLDEFIETSKDQIKALQENRDKLLSAWNLKMENS
jgi:sugar-specific transcriptional regulator TrmB